MKWTDDEVDYYAVDYCMMKLTVGEVDYYAVDFQ